MPSFPFEQLIHNIIVHEINYSSRGTNLGVSIMVAQYR